MNELEIKLAAENGFLREQLKEAARQRDELLAVVQQVNCYVKAVSGSKYLVRITDAAIAAARKG